MGVVNSVSAWLTIRPPTIEMPSDCENVGAEAERERKRAEDRGECRHHDGTEAHQAGLIDRLARGKPAVAFRLEREIDHHDGVLLDDADEEQDADEGEEREGRVRDDEGENRADARRRQRRQDCQRMDVALVEHAQHDIDGDDRRQDKQGLAGEGLLEDLRVARKSAVDGNGHVQLPLIVRWMASVAVSERLRRPAG